MTEEPGTRITVINIEWEKRPYSSEAIQKFDTDIDYGLYQIYGRHEAYGQDALLYIGKAEDQTFAKRLKDRHEFVEWYHTPASIRLGRIIGPNRESKEPLGWSGVRWKEIINICERILLRAFSPALNKKDNTGLFSEDLHEFNKENFLIINWGDYGQLSTEVSTLRASYRYWGFEKELSQKENTTGV